MVPESENAPAPRRRARRWRRTAQNAIALIVLYGNAAVALQPPPIRQLRLHLPCPLFLLDAFLITGMFNSYSLVNTDLYIAGQRTREGLIADRLRWIDLPVREHFAQRQGIVFTQMFATHQWDIHGLRAQQRAWKDLARRIREHHNRLHPQHKVSRVSFGIVFWPQSPAGYRALKRAPLVKTQSWYTEPEER
jgi:hypothetical protein